MSSSANAFPTFGPNNRMAARLQAHDWANSELGPRAAWPHSLSLALNICMDSDFPIALWWGPRLIQFYNDAYQPILGDDKDVTAFGGAALDSWGEIWDTIGPMVAQVVEQGETVKGEDLPLHIHRNGALGLAHFTFSYSPVRDENGVVLGMFTAAVETTERVGLERRQAFRLKLAEDLRQASEPDAALQVARAALTTHLEAQYVGFGEIDPAARCLKPGADAGNSVPIAQLTPAQCDALSAGQALRIDDLAAHPEVRFDAGMAALLVVPLAEDMRANSVLMVGKATPYGWTDADLLSVRESLDQIEGVVSRLRAEQLVRKQLASEAERLRRLFDQAPSFIAVTRGPEHVYELANAAYMRAAGQRDILGKPARIALPELSEQGYHELLDQVYASGQPHLGHGTPIRLQRTPGAALEELIIDFIYQPMRDAEGRITGILMEGSDVTLQYRAQADLRRERDQSRHLLASMKEGFAIVDANWAVRQINDEGLRLTRRSRDQAIGMSQWDLWPGLRGTEAEAMFRRVRASDSAEMQDVCIALGEGEPVWLELRVYPLIDGELAFFFRDITPRKTAQQQLRDANERKDEFLAMLAHELRNPLAPISAAADLLRMAQVDEARLRQTSGIITRQVRHMTSLVNDLMDVSRVTRGLVTLEHEILDAQQIVADAIEQTRPLIDARRHRLQLDLAPQPVFVRGDRKRLVQVLANLLNNAAKYTPEGGAIVLALRVEGTQVTFSVRDNGIGMAQELMRDVFELFMQAKRSPDRSQGGLGIGLALVRSLVELHGGQVAVHSSGPGAGSEFTVALPRAASGSAALEAPQHIAAVAAAQRLRILVVDDNVDAAQMLSMFLDSAGHQVEVEHTPEAALARSRGETFDVFLLDIGLPQMDGCELARRLRAQDERLERAPATYVAITGYGQEADRRNTRQAGFAYHFVKPVDAPELARLLARLAEHAQAGAGAQDAA